MNTRGRAIGEAAERLIGTPYRLHGRDPATGLDCVGLVGAALTEAGLIAILPEGYRLRQIDLGPYGRLAQDNRLIPAGGEIRAGDIALVRPGPGQAHLLVRGMQRGWIHAHAGLRRVTALGASSPWPELARWRTP